ncbi:hypothetical protein CYMTET_39679 [Cymbomonas tetramitiformis]|uniref:Uncharacterized protein n=1 Tax=Cymbomonas tetramitiformis TaxID=36881 RepID=A0AAE0CBB6_9CHLO|nr:hypothetical protein CYMTET_39679 [Cymbomonas tetramitiformis]
MAQHRVAHLYAHALVERTCTCTNAVFREGGEQVTAMFTAPTALRAIRKEDPEALLLAKYDTSHFKGMFLAGERCDPVTLEWAGSTLGVPIVDNWWQTESGWPIASQCPGIAPLPIKPGSAGPPVPGYNIQIVDANGKQVPAGTEGNVVIKLPLPPGTFPSLWRKDEHYVKTYMSMFPGYYNSGDAGMIDKDGYVHIMGRTDDIINVAGHRLSTGGMEEVVGQHPAVAECAVIAAADVLKGELPVGLIVLKDGSAFTAKQVEAEVVELVRAKIGAVAAFKKIVTVAKLPKTRSGKILRGVMKKMADGQPWKAPPTIDDTSLLPEIIKSLQSIGYAKAKAKL